MYLFLYNADSLLRNLYYANINLQANYYQNTKVKNDNIKQKLNFSLIAKA